MKLSLEKQNFHYLLVPFIVQNKKKSESRSLDMRTDNFSAKMIHFPRIRFFLEKPLIKFPYVSWLLLLCKIVKQFAQQIQSCEDVPF